jgi:hypothetical protein
VHHLVAISLIIFAVAVVSGLVLAGVRGLVAWRALTSFKRTTAESMLAATVLLERLEARTAGAADRAARLTEAQAQLKQSLAQAAVCGEAASEVWSLVQRARLITSAS